MFSNFIFSYYVFVKKCFSFSFELVKWNFTSYSLKLIVCFKSIREPVKFLDFLTHLAVMNMAFEMRRRLLFPAIYDIGSRLMKRIVRSTNFVKLFFGRWHEPGTWQCFLHPYFGCFGVIALIVKVSRRNQLFSELWTVTHQPIWNFRWKGIRKFACVTERLSYLYRLNISGEKVILFIDNSMTNFLNVVFKLLAVFSKFRLI